MNANLKSLMRMTALAIAVAAPLVAAPAMAKQLSGIETTYYSDATKTVIVGTFIRTCEGHILRTGTITPYFDSIIEEC